MIKILSGILARLEANGYEYTVLPVGETVAIETEHGRATLCVVDMAHGKRGSVEVHYWVDRKGEKIEQEMGMTLDRTVARYLAGK